MDGLSGGAVVCLNELKERATGKILCPRAGVLVVDAGLHVVFQREIQAELASVGKSQGGADAVGSLHVDSLDRGGLHRRHHAADAKTGRNSEARVDRNGKKKVGQNGDLVIVALEVDLLAALNVLAADGETAVGLKVVEAVDHKARGELKGKPVGNPRADGHIHAEARVVG